MGKKNLSTKNLNLDSRARQVAHDSFDNGTRAGANVSADAGRVQGVVAGGAVLGHGDGRGGDLPRGRAGNTAGDVENQLHGIAGDGRGQDRGLDGAVAVARRALGGQDKDLVVDVVRDVAEAQARRARAVDGRIEGVVARRAEQGRAGARGRVARGREVAARARDRVADVGRRRARAVQVPDAAGDGDGARRVDVGGQLDRLPGHGDDGVSKGRTARDRVDHALKHVEAGGSESQVLGEFLHGDIVVRAVQAQVGSVTDVGSGDEQSTQCAGSLEAANIC